MHVCMRVCVYIYVFKNVDRFVYDRMYEYTKAHTDMGVRSVSWTLFLSWLQLTVWTLNARFTTHCSVESTSSW